MLTETLRPKKLDQVIGQESIIKLFKHFIAIKKFPNLIIHGSPGVGKTCTVMSFASEFYKEREYLYINASLYRTIKDIQNETETFLRTFGKCVILDECDCLTKKSMELLSEYTTRFPDARFCFICNYPDNISKSIYSNSITIHFPPLNPNDISKFTGCNYTFTDMRIALNISEINGISIDELIKLFLESDSNLDCILYSYGHILDKFLESLNEYFELKFTRIIIDTFNYYYNYENPDISGLKRLRDLIKNEKLEKDI